MPTADDSPTLGASVIAVRARVELSSTARRDLEAAAGRGAVFFQAGVHDADHLSLSVYLTAEVSDGRAVRSGPGPDIGVGGPRRGIWHRWHGSPLPQDPREADRIVLFEHRAGRHDIEDAINQMLGRDPTLHRPPRLSWDRLINALAAACVRVTEPELIEAPLTVELSRDVKADLSRGGG